MAKIEYVKARDGYAIEFVGGLLGGKVVVMEERKKPVLRNRNFGETGKGRVALGSFLTEEQEIEEGYLKSMEIA